MLVPRPGVEEWELWQFAWEGATAYVSFADFLLERYVTRPDHRPRPEHADAYVDAFRSGRSFSLGLLAEIDDPRALELAVDALEDGSEDTRIPPLLGQIGDPQAIPALQRAYGSGTIWTMRAAALSALEALGDPDAGLLLRDAAHSPDADLRRWATARLAGR